MLIRIYNQNGNIKVTKTTGYREMTMFSSVSDGETVEIDVDTCISTTSRKKRPAVNEA